MKQLLFVLVIVLVIALLLPTNANANPGNVEPLQKGTWFGQSGVAANGTATFYISIVGVRVAGVNALKLLDQGNTTYQKFGDAWSGSTPQYAQAIAQASGKSTTDTISASTPFGLADLLHGVFFAEASHDPTNYIQRLVGSTWAFL